MRSVAKRSFFWHLILWLGEGNGSGTVQRGEEAPRGTVFQEIKHFSVIFILKVQNECDGRKVKPRALR